MKNLFLIFFLTSSLSLASTEYILSVSSSQKVSPQIVKGLIQGAQVISSKPLFNFSERVFLEKISAHHLKQSWILKISSETEAKKLKALIKTQKLGLRLEPNSIPLEAATADFSQFQWGLSNQGEDQILDLDPVKTYRVPGVRGQDIRLPFKNATTNKKIIVAVLDTGIDKTHPDLQGKILRKESECKALEKFNKCTEESDRATCEKKWMTTSNPEVDLDKNGYPMDCEGWSLLGPVNASDLMGKPDFGDDQGHGTHVAGIIAASRENSVGVMGVSNQVQILPVQVIGIQPTEPIKPMSIDPHESQLAGKNQSLGDLLARGVLYAMRSGAQVINFSLGWPQARDSEFMRDVIAEAQKQGVIIVAAAGNDSTRALLRPCAYPGVICVAAHGPDGALAHFSNFGSGVDLAAPGINILSTYPEEKRSVRFRAVHGYEFLSGTSQAAPFVTGVVADLLAHGVPKEEIYPRLILGSRKPEKNLALIEGSSHLQGQSRPVETKSKYILSGLMDVQSSLQINKQPLLLPINKESVEISWDRKSKKFTYQFPVKNFWQDISFADVKIQAQYRKNHAESIRPQLNSIRFVETGSLWKMGEVRHVEVVSEITDSDNSDQSRIPSELELIVYLKAKEKIQTFLVESEIVVPLTSDTTGKDIIDFKLSGIPEKRFDFIPVDEVWDRRPEFQDYVLVSQEGKKWELSLLQQKNGTYARLGPVQISVFGDTEKIRSQVSRVLQNGKTYYILSLLEDLSEEEEPKASPMTLHFFDENFKRVQTIKYDSELAQIPYAYFWMSLQGQRVPAWVGFGKDPEARRGLREIWENPNNDEQSKLRFYYVTTEGQVKAVQKYEGFDIIDVIEPTQEQKSNGIVPLLLAKNRGTEFKPSYIYDFAVAEIKDGEVSRFKALEFFGRLNSFRNLLDTRVDKIHNLDRNTEKYAGTFWFSEGRAREQKLSIYLNSSFNFKDFDLLALDNVFDSALWVRAVFSGAHRQGAFVLTNSEIQFHDLKSGKALGRSFERYTFFPDSFMTNAYFPITLVDQKKSESLLPALFTTEGSGLNRGVKLVVPSYTTRDELIELYSPARLRFVSQKGCRPLNTAVYLGPQGYAFDYFCGNKIKRINLTY